MKTKWLLLCALLLFPLFFAGCVGEEEPIFAAYELYFPTRDKSFGAPALGAEACRIQEGEEAIPEILRLLLEGPTQENLAAVIPNGTMLRDWRLKDGILTVDFSSRYGLLSGIDLTLADYSVTMSLCQVPGVSAVVTTVEGDRITYRNRESLKEEDIFFAVSHSEPRQRQVTLFFPRKAHKDLGQESRILSLTQDDKLLPAVLGALTQGPRSRGFEPVLCEGDLLSFALRESLCTLNFSPAFVAHAPDSIADARARLQALISSLCELEGITSVTFLAEGSPLQRYGPLSLTEALEERHIPAAPNTP